MEEKELKDLEKELQEKKQKLAVMEKTEKVESQLEAVNQKLQKKKNLRGWFGKIIKSLKILHDELMKTGEALDKMKDNDSQEKTAKREEKVYHIPTKIL